MFENFNVQLGVFAGYATQYWYRSFILNDLICLNDICYNEPFIGMKVL